MSKETWNCTRAAVDKRYQYFRGFCNPAVERKPNLTIQSYLLLSVKAGSTSVLLRLAWSLGQLREPCEERGRKAWRVCLAWLFQVLLH